MKKIYIAIITILVALISCNTVYALSEDELKQKRDELSSKIQAAGTNLENIEVELTETLEAINALDEELYIYEEKIQEISKSLAEIEKQINESEKSLKEIEAKYDYQNGLLEKRLVYAYKSGKTRYIDVLLNSKDIMDFISKYHLISEIIRYDDNLLKSINQQRNKIIEINTQLNKNRQELNDYKEEQKKIVISIENAKIVKSSYANQLTKEEIKIKEEIEVYQQELDLIEIEILLTAMADASSDYVGGAFAWPAPGYYTITSTYGMRMHPILKVYRNHGAIDIGAPLGSNIIAANDGIVTKSTYSYSYGNMIMIDHGGGVTTLYAHGSELVARVGDKVKKGDVIMKTGSTGWSTGPHLHFEIRIDGKTIDPYYYIIPSISR